MPDQSAYIVRRIDSSKSMEALTAFPSYFEIETVNACNARCPMCTIDDWDRRDGLMSDALFEKIADEIGAHSGVVKRVALYRDGEPLMDKKLAAKVAALKGRGVKRVGISTNAALLTEEKAEALLRAGIDEVLLSVDSLKPSVYEAIRVRLKFDEVMANCLRFIELRDKLGSPCQVWVRMVRQEANRDEWPQFQSFWKLHLKPSDRVDYHNIHNWGGQLVNFKQISTADVEKPCVALWSLMVIFANGDVPMCNVDYNNRYPLGSVADTSIAELWRGQEQNRRRELHMAGQRHELAPCISCNVWSESQTDRKAA
jgi:radical SAM protein with 4Fe4S-binding SPASM domain